MQLVLSNETKARGATLSMQGLQITDFSDGTPLLVCTVGHRTREAFLR